MVLDTSAVLAILLCEAEAPAFADAIAADPVRLLSAASLLEATMVIESRFGEAGGRELDLFIHRAGIVVSAVNAEEVAVARVAFGTFGKGRHPAGLNSGDLFAYALSRTSGEPLLFKGDDFAKTDVVPVTPGPE
jgi:ribonuclease VapC